MLVRFLSRGFHNGSIVEPGEVISVPEDTFLGQHMVRVDGENDHLVDAQPFAGVFRADLAYSVNPDDVRAQLTEELRQRAEATRLREVEEEAQRVAASTGQQPDPPAEPETPDTGGDAADG